MIPYIFYYIFCLLLLFLNKKWIPILFPLIWFFFIGFRDGIGTDYYTTLASVERSYIDLNNIGGSFVGYNLFDLEFDYKIISIFLCYFKIDVNVFYVVISFIESWMIYFLLKKVKHKKILLVYFVTMFTLNYPMNICRSGFSVLTLVFALNYFSTERYIKRNITIVFSCLAHYASIPIIMLSIFRFKNVKVNIIALLLIFALFYTFKEMIFLRWPTDGDPSISKFQGYGIKLLISTLLILSINYFVVEKKIFTQENVLLIAIMIATYMYNPLARLNMYYAFVVVFNNLFKINNKKIGMNSMLLLFSIPILALFSEWLEISRYVSLPTLGHWLPYKSLLFNLY